MANHFTKARFTFVVTPAEAGMIPPEMAYAATDQS